MRLQDMSTKQLQAWIDKLISALSFPDSNVKLYRKWLEQAETELLNRINKNSVVTCARK